MTLGGKGQLGGGAPHDPTARNGCEGPTLDVAPVAVKAPVLQTELDTALRYVAAVHELLEWAPVGLVPKREAVPGLRSPPSG